MDAIKGGALEVPSKRNRPRTRSNQDGKSPPRRAQGSPLPRQQRRSEISKGSGDGEKLEAPGLSNAGGSERVEGNRRSPRTREKGREEVEVCSLVTGQGRSEASPSGRGGRSQRDMEKEGAACGESARDDVSETDSALRNSAVGGEKEKADPVAPTSEIPVRRGRPRKYPPVEPAPHDVPGTKKRGRGRPRKYPPVEPAPRDVPGTKKRGKKGRPKKVPEESGHRLPLFTTAPGGLELREGGRPKEVPEESAHRLPLFSAAPGKEDMPRKYESGESARRDVPKRKKRAKKRGRPRKNPPEEPARLNVSKMKSGGGTRKAVAVAPASAIGIRHDKKGRKTLKSASGESARRNVSETKSGPGTRRADPVAPASKIETRLSARVEGIFERFVKNLPKPRRRCDRCQDVGLPPEECNFKFPCARCKLAGVKCTLNYVSPFCTREELQRFQQSNQRKIMLVGGRTEGDWDDFDFRVEAIPIRGRRDPGPGVYVPTEEEEALGRETNIEWCRWVVTSVGFFPPRGRPGMAQLAGIEPGNELSGVWICPDVRVEAGCMGRAWMAKELRRMAQWGRPRGPGIPKRERFLSDDHVEWEFPWELEFYRREVAVEEAFSRAGMGDAVECEEEEEAIKSSVSSSISSEGTKREHPLSYHNTFLTFRVFRESGCARDGGRVFTVRVAEENESVGEKCHTEVNKNQYGTNELWCNEANRVASMMRGPSTGGSGSQAAVPPPEENTFEALRLLGLSPETTDMIRRRVDLSDDYDKERFFGGLGRGGVGDSGALEGEERVVLPMILDGTGGSGEGSGSRHLLAGLAPAAVRLVKERVYTTARVQYACLYGLCSPASSGSAALGAVSEAVPKSAPEPATTPASPSVSIDDRIASDDGSSVMEATGGDAGKDRELIKSEGGLSVSMEGVGDEELGPEKPGSNGAGMRESGRSKRRRGGGRSTSVDDGDQGVEPQERLGKARGCGQASRNFDLAGGKGKGRAEPRTDAAAGKRQRDAVIAVSHRPGSGALTAKLLEMIRSDVFLSWVRELRRRSGSFATGKYGAWPCGDGDGKGGGAPGEEGALVARGGSGMWAMVDSVAAPCRSRLRFAVGFMPIVALDLGFATEGKMAAANDDRVYPAVFESLADAVANKALAAKEVNIEAFFSSAATAAATSKQEYQNAECLQKALRLAAEEVATRLLPTYTRDEMEKICAAAVGKGSAGAPREGSFTAAVCRSLRELSFDAATAATGVSRRTERALPKTGFRFEPTKAEAAEAAALAGALCFVCKLPLASKCECSFRSLAIRRKCWAERISLRAGEGSSVAIDLGIPSSFRGHLPHLRDDIASHKRNKGRFKVRYDQSVSLHHRGLLRFSLNSNITSWTPSDLEALRPLNRSRKPAAEGDASGAATEKASPSLPRLEKWPGFPSPATAFAPAAPSENPKGSMPPSPRLLRYIHQMASIKVHGMTEMYGSLDGSALVAVGVLVEEMLEELISPLVDGRTKGYKHLTPASLARELAFSNRTNNRTGLDQAPLPPPPPKSGAPVEFSQSSGTPPSKKRRCASTEMSNLEAAAAAVPAMDAPELRALCRVYGARATEVVCAWEKIEKGRQPADNMAQGIAENASPFDGFELE